MEDKKQFNTTFMNGEKSSFYYCLRELKCCTLSSMVQCGQTMQTSAPSSTQEREL